MEATGYQGTKLGMTQEPQTPASTHVAASLGESITAVRAPPPCRAAGRPATGVTLTCGSFWDLRVGLSGRLLAGGSLIH